MKNAKILTGFVLMCVMHASYADITSLEVNSKSSAELNQTARDAATVEIKKRQEFFESLEKLPQEEQSIAIERWRKEEAVREALRVKSPEEIALENKTQAELDAEARTYRKASLERQITHLEKSMDEKRQAALPAKRVSGKLGAELVSNDIAVEKSAGDSAENSAEESIRAEIDELSLKCAKAELAASDLPIERQMELSAVWSASADGKRMLELQEALHEIMEAKRVEDLKKSIAALEKSLTQKSLDADMREANELQLKHLEMRLSDAEFTRAFDRLPEDSKAAAISAHRAKQERLQAEIEKTDTAQKLSNERMEQSKK